MSMLLTIPLMSSCQCQSVAGRRAAGVGAVVAAAAQGPTKAALLAARREGHPCSQLWALLQLHADLLPLRQCWSGLASCTWATGAVTCVRACAWGRE